MAIRDNCTRSYADAIVISAKVLSKPAGEGSIRTHALPLLLHQEDCFSDSYEPL